MKNDGLITYLGKQEKITHSVAVSYRFLLGQNCQNCQKPKTKKVIESPPVEFPPPPPRPPPVTQEIFYWDMHHCVHIVCELS